MGLHGAAWGWHVGCKGLHGAAWGWHVGPLLTLLAHAHVAHRGGAGEGTQRRLEPRLDRSDARLRRRGFGFGFGFGLGLG